MMKTVREQVLDLLLQVEKEKSYAQLSLKYALTDLDQRDKALATEIFYGTLKYQIQLDYFLNQYAKTPVKKMKPLIRNVLRMSLYQLLYLDKIPSSACINEAVKIVKKRKMQGLSGFVNGVLRQIDREKENLTFPDANQSLSRFISIRYALPEWVVKRWLMAYGKQRTMKISEALNHRAEVCIRCNTLKSDVAHLKDALTAENMKYTQGRLLEEALYVKQVNDLQHSPSFKEGLWTVQDESAMLVAKVASPAPKSKVLDMCSAPGGKTMHMAALMKNQGEIIACDVHPHKLELIAKNAQRLGISIIHPTLQDGTIYREEWQEQFDTVLLDAPCSGLGIMKRKPDIRLHKTEEDLKEIVAIQKALFKNAIRYVKKGGHLIYSTCTISKEENEQMVEEMAIQYGLELVNIGHTIPEVLKQDLKAQGMLQILPDVADTDGFFIASLRKKGNF